jgi:hypothetical protein
MKTFLFNILNYNHPTPTTIDCYIGFDKNSPLYGIRDLKLPTEKIHFNKKFCGYQYEFFCDNDLDKYDNNKELLYKELWLFHFLCDSSLYDLEETCEEVKEFLLSQLNINKI